MSGRKGNGLWISDPFVMKPGCVGGIPPAQFANHAPFPVMFSNATICGKRCRHLSIIALPLSASVGSITRSVLQEQDEATRAMRYRFLKQSEREKLTLYLKLKKIQ